MSPPAWSLVSLLWVTGAGGQQAGLGLQVPGDCWEWRALVLGNVPNSLLCPCSRSPSPLRGSLVMDAGGFAD